MKKFIFTHILGTGKAAVVVLSLAALIISGASSASRLQELDKKNAEQAVAPVDDQQIVPAPPSPEEAAHKMATEGKPNTQPVALVAAPILMQPDNDRRMLDAHTTVDCQADLSVVETPVFAAPASSLSLISPQAGRQFTLVGAKPSGTS